MEGSIYAKVLEVRGAHYSGVEDMAKTNQVVRVGMRVVVNGKASKVVKTALRPRNHILEGADFTSASADSNPIEDILRQGYDADGVVKFTVYQRLRTDLIDTVVLGTTTIPVSEITAGSMVKAEPVTLALVKGAGKPNGELAVALWTTKALQKPDIPTWVLWFKPALGMCLATTVCAGALLGFPRLAFYSALPVALAWAYLELPKLIGTALTKILALAVPGLNMSVSAVRLQASLCGSLLVGVDVDDFKLAHDESYEFYHESFVAAKRVSLALRFDVASLVANVIAAVRRGTSTVETESLVLAASAKNLAAKDHFLTTKSSSDPYFRIVVAPTDEVHAHALSEKNADFDADACVEICRSETIEDNLNPRWKDVEIDEGVVESKRRGRKLLVVVMDYDYGTASDLIGIGEIEALSGDGTVVELRKRGAPAGEFAFATRKTVVEHKQPAIAWKPSPTEHAALRKEAGVMFEPTRLATLVLDLKIDDPVIAFDTAEINDEFNVNNFVRLLSEGKITSKTGLKTMPNTLRVSVNAVRFDAETTKEVKVVVALRGEELTFGPVEADGATATGFPAIPDAIAVADPSAVVQVKVFVGSSLLGDWICKLETLAVAPTRVFGKNVVASRDGSEFKLGGLMQVRADDRAVPAGADIDLTLTWTHDPNGMTHNQILEVAKLKALEQLQQNSAEFNLSLGNLGLWGNFLADFPLLFSVNTLELNRIKFHLKALFMGYDTDRSDEAIYVDQIDLRDDLKSSTGVDLATLGFDLVTSIAGPVLKEVSILDAAKQILQGVSIGLFSSEKDNEAYQDDNDDAEE
ncbi:hypothetical protein CTAYLR_008395 [Chrysophaeum taylorii]|uniref:C2 domain-containing protein n=1 Tax=Chrysophaeum taylorii TaxID=2483200 RepID=A0AAD7UI46_9STRA|nr:hypothetical protein CTAYLR_008395 [Chrysophaeum taylorii]